MVGLAQQTPRLVLVLELTVGQVVLEVVRLRGISVWQQRVALRLHPHQAKEAQGVILQLPQLGVIAQEVVAVQVVQVQLEQRILAVELEVRVALDYLILSLAHP